MSNEPEVLNIYRAADYLGISTDTLYKYAAAGTVPAFKLGNRWRFLRSALWAWMEQEGAKNVAVKHSPEA